MASSCYSHVRVAGHCFEMQNSNLFSECFDLLLTVSHLILYGRICAAAVIIKNGSYSGCANAAVPFGPTTQPPSMAVSFPFPKISHAIFRGEAIVGREAWRLSRLRNTVIGEAIGEKTNVLIREDPEDETKHAIESVQSLKVTNTISCRPSGVSHCNIAFSDEIHLSRTCVPRWLQFFDQPLKLQTPKHIVSWDLQRQYPLSQRSD